LGSLSHSLQMFLANGYAVRDRLSLDTWRILDTISEEWEMMKKEQSLSRIGYNLDNLIIKLMAFHGLNIDNMTREHTWNILNIGRLIESSTKTCVLLDTILFRQFELETEKTLLEYALMANESLVTYRYMYRSTLEVYAVLKLLLLDELNPKSVSFQIQGIDEHLKHLPSIETRFLNPIRKKILEATTFVRMCDPLTLASITKGEAVRNKLNNFMISVIALLGDVSDMVNEHYFSHVQNQYSFVSTKIPEV